MTLTQRAANHYGKPGLYILAMLNGYLSEYLSENNVHFEEFQYGGYVYISISREKSKEKFLLLQLKGLNKYEINEIVEIKKCLT